MAFSSVQIKVSLKSSMLRAEMGNALQVTRYKYLNSESVFFCATHFVTGSSSYNYIHFFCCMLCFMIGQIFSFWLVKVWTSGRPVQPLNSSTAKQCFCN